MKKRRANGYPDPNIVVGHGARRNNIKTQAEPFGVPYGVAPYTFEGEKSSGSSGMMALRYALVELEFDYAVMCGIPMTATAHFDRPTRFGPKTFMRPWKNLPLEIKRRSFSMSGWTRQLLGPPPSSFSKTVDTESA